MTDSFAALDLDAAREAVVRALAEDLGPEGHAGDLTRAATVPEGARAEAAIVAREPGVLAGMPVAALVFEAVGGGAVRFEPAAAEGARFEAGAALGRVAGAARALLAGERVALNFLQRMCGIATLARRFADAVEGTRARIYDTRKTTPGLRALEKYAVRAGGATNHRIGLYDAGLVKDNHLAVLARAGGVAPDEVDLRPAVAAMRKKRPGAKIEIEATTLRGVERALEAAPDVILLDNMSVEDMRRAVEVVAGRAALEASGGVRLESVRAIAETGVDRVSVGALTHGARAIDIALEFEPS